MKELHELNSTWGFDFTYQSNKEQIRKEIYQGKLNFLTTKVWNDGNLCVNVYWRGVRLSRDSMSMIWSILTAHTYSHLFDSRFPQYYNLFMRDNLWFIWIWMLYCILKTIINHIYYCRWYLRVLVSINGIWRLGIQGFSRLSTITLNAGGYPHT